MFEVRTFCCIFKLGMITGDSIKVSVTGGDMDCWMSESIIRGK